MLLSILSALGGGLLRLLPEILNLLHKKEDNTHELKMLDKQFQLEQLRSDNKVREIEVQGNFDQVIALLEAQKTALQGQMQKTGVRIVDALNFLVRPVVTYVLLSLYVLHKLGGAVMLYATGSSLSSVFVQIYSPDDFALLSGVLAFWFVGRVFDKVNK
jgi:hypothetical protein